MSELWMSVPLVHLHGGGDDGWSPVGMGGGGTKTHMLGAGAIKK